MSTAQTQRTWTEDRVEALKAMLANGCSASEVAFEIGGVSRNAVIGKARRMGLALRPRAHVDAEEQWIRRREYVRRYRATHPQSFHRERKPHLPAAEANELPPDHSECAVTFAQLDRDHCRYPLGEPSDMATFRYCGEARLGERPYCARHCRVAYRPIEERARP